MVRHFSMLLLSLDQADTNIWLSARHLQSSPMLLLSF